MGDSALYRPILKKSWQVTKKFKGLWFFGLFVALLGSSGEYEILSRVILNQYANTGLISDTISSIRLGIVDGLKAGGDLWSNAWSSLTGNPATFAFIAIIFILGVVITIFLVWLALISQIGIIKNVNSISQNKKPTINEGIDFAVKNFWPATVVNVIFRVVLFFIFLLMGWEIALTDKTQIIGSIFYYLSFIFFIAVIFVVSFISKYQLFFIILKKQSITKALKSAWQLFVKNWLVSLEMAVVLFAVNTIIVILTLLLSAMLIIAPVLLMAFFKLPAFMLGLLSIIDLILIIGFTFFVTATLMTFIWSSWTLLYSRLTDEGAISKIIRLNRQLFSADKIN